MKYLIALLNSKLIKFWLKNKGKMQGNNFQIDKEPILEIPIKMRNRKYGKSMHGGIIHPIKYMFNMFYSIIIVIIKHISNKLTRKK